MASFPFIHDIPEILDTTGWRWEAFVSPHTPSHGFWVGFDREGNRWLTKLRGNFYAYREIVFARLAQRMGWFCQSSAFLRLDKQSAKVLGVSTSEVHAAHWFMKEHAQTACSPECQLKFLFGRSVETVDNLSGSEIEHLLDWPKSEFAACLFGANEPSGRLFTTDHEFVIIDSEQMFSTNPCTLDNTAWWSRPDGRPSLTGRALAIEVCRDLCDLSSADIEDALTVPKGVSIHKKNQVELRLKASRKFAAEFCASYEQA